MHRDRGSATAETAVVLPALLLVTALCVWAVASVAVHVRCLDAARAGARAMARGEAAGVVVAFVERRAPPTADVTVDEAPDGGLVSVEVRVRVALPGPWPGTGPGVVVGGRAVADVEG